MADPRAFVSFDFDHNQVHKTLFVGQAKSDSPTSFTVVEDWSSKASLPQAEWERLINRKIASTNMLIVLVGKSMSTATGVVKEGDRHGQGGERPRLRGVRRRRWH